LLPSSIFPLPYFSKGIGDLSAGQLLPSSLFPLPSPLVLSVVKMLLKTFLSPASLEFAEGAEKDDLFYEKSLRGRFFITPHASGGGAW
jgi:hypothetical protein